MHNRYVTLVLSAAGDGVTVITMDRPDLRNAMNSQMMRDLRDCFAGYNGNVDAARCLILTGAGDKAFCAGADLKERAGMDDATWRRQHAIIEEMIRVLMDCPLPIIAAVNGAAYAGGCELAMACDFIYAAETARFAQSEVTLGIIPGAMGTQNMPRAVGVRRAKEIVLTGQPFSAAEAEQWGLVNRVVTGDRLMADVRQVAQGIAANAPIAVCQAKKALDKAADLDRAAGYAFELGAYNRTVPTQDRQEGIRAFNEKRKPRFEGK